MKNLIQIDFGWGFFMSACFWYLVVPGLVRMWRFAARNRPTGYA